jgi:WD40 repeat protein
LGRLGALRGEAAWRRRALRANAIEHPAGGPAPYARGDGVNSDQKLLKATVLFDVWTWGQSNRPINLLSQDGRYLAFGGSVLDLEHREELGKPEPLSWQSAFAFSRNGQRLVIAGLQDESVVVRDLPSGATRSFFAEGKIDAATLSPDARVVAVALRGGKLQLWKQPDGAPLRSLSGPEAVRALFYAAGGARLVVAHEAGVCVYDANGADELYFSRVDSRLLSFAFDGDLLAAASVEGEVLLLDVARGALLARARLGTQPVNALAVSSAHKLLFAADGTGAVGLWRLIERVEAR